MDEHVDYSILLKTAVWLLPVAQLPRPYAATLVKRSICGQVGNLGQDVHIVFGLGIARPCRKEHFFIGEEHGITCYSQESDHSKQCRLASLLI